MLNHLKQNCETKDKVYLFLKIMNYFRKRKFELCLQSFVSQVLDRNFLKIKLPQFWSKMQLKFGEMGRVVKLGIQFQSMKVNTTK